MRGARQLPCRPAQVRPGRGATREWTMLYRRYVVVGVGCNRRGGCLRPRAGSPRRFPHRGTVRGGCWGMPSPRFRASRPVRRVKTTTCGLRRSSDGLFSTNPLIAVRLVVGDAPPVIIPYLRWLARGLEGLEMGKSCDDGDDSPGQATTPAFRPLEARNPTAFRTVKRIHLGRECASKEGLDNAS